MQNMLSDQDQHIRFLDQTHSFVSVSSWAQFPWIIQVCLQLMRFLCCYVKDGLLSCARPQGTRRQGCQKKLQAPWKERIYDTRACDFYNAFKDGLYMNKQHPKSGGTFNFFLFNQSSWTLILTGTQSETFHSWTNGISPSWIRKIVNVYIWDYWWTYTIKTKSW